jgi:patatin-like phospholipase/acyl hydrolase
MFNFFAGSSIGGIMALALAKGLSAKKLLEKFDYDLIQKIFPC